MSWLFLFSRTFIFYHRLTLSHIIHTHTHTGGWNGGFAGQQQQQQQQQAGGWNRGWDNRGWRGGRGWRALEGEETSEAVPSDDDKITVNPNHIHRHSLDDLTAIAPEPDSAKLDAAAAVAPIPAEKEESDKHYWGGGGRFGIPNGIPNLGNFQGVPSFGGGVQNQVQVSTPFAQVQHRNQVGFGH